MIKINKQLSRTDGLVIPSGSVIDYKVRKIENDLYLHFILKHYLNEEKKYLPINFVNEFAYKVYLKCEPKQFESLTDYSIQMLLKEHIDSKLGVGYSEII
jgi:hypothetical protein